MNGGEEENNICLPLHIFMTIKKKKNKKEWWQKIFSHDYIKTYIDTTPEKITNKQVSFLIDKLKPVSKKKILDLGCGYGRHTLKMAKLGCSITGLDYSKVFLDIAKKQAKAEGIKANFVLGDMKKLTFKNKFDAVICMFTSFGYFYEQTDHEAVIQGVAKALKTKGVFLLDLNNPAYRLAEIIKNSEPGRKKEILISKKIFKLSNGLKVAMTQEFNLITMRWKLIRKWKEAGKQKEYFSDIYLFTFPEIKYLLERNGFKVEKTWGNFDSSPFNLQSRRLIILAIKK